VGDLDPNDEDLSLGTPHLGHRRFAHEVKMSAMTEELAKTDNLNT
jgi:hypothetical protein